ncbi:dehydration-responsive element-binding protein 1B-like [Trifolium pratense]|uniref:dehydration-responsive element-binding protein 1B-like n=1 Tax=Trifolium pratense TaxID=57577 RepID=UPI001E692765|nr:dehydration-responsive element-binding protein 1B-like [Trifolium pratense]
MNLENESTTNSHANTKANPYTHKKKTGRKKFKQTRHPIYRGIRQRNGKKWVSEIREPNKKKSRIWLGTYATPEMAAIAHDIAVLAFKGTSAIFNFPNSISLLPVLKSTSAKDIREAAKTFTNTRDETKSCLVECKSQESVFKGDNIEIMNNDIDESKTMFFDEEVLFNMPCFLNNMAEGLLITPPSMKSALDWDNVDCEMDLTLWAD